MKKTKFKVGDWFCYLEWDKAYYVKEVHETTVTIYYRSSEGTLRRTSYPIERGLLGNKVQIKNGIKDLGDLYAQICFGTTFVVNDKVQFSNGTKKNGIVDGIYTDRNGQLSVVVKWPEEAFCLVYLPHQLEKMPEQLLVSGHIVEKIDDNTVKVGCTEVKKEDAEKIMEFMGW